MTDTAQTIVAVTTAVLPTLAVLVGILINRNDVNRIDSRIAALDSSLRGEISAARAQSHSEFLLLMGRDTEIDARISAVERRLPS